MRRTILSTPLSIDSRGRPEAADQAAATDARLDQDVARLERDQGQAALDRLAQADRDGPSAHMLVDTDARQQMELFKACEKEMKTKAFSKEGLSAAVKLDPMDVLKEEMSNFISETVTELGRQIEVAEAEVESLQGGAKKKRGAPNERIAEVEALNERRRWHVSRLELILRLLENGQIPPTKVADIQTDVKYFLESNTVRRRPRTRLSDRRRRRTLWRTRASTTISISSRPRSNSG